MFIKKDPIVYNTTKTIYVDHLAIMVKDKYATYIMDEKLRL